MKIAAHSLEIGVETVRRTLTVVRARHHVETTIQAYRVAPASGELRVG